MADAINKVTDTVGKTAQGATDAAGQGVKDVGKGASDATKGATGQATGGSSGGASGGPDHLGLGKTDL